ncbi:MAG: T9SS type A sorting domain-containing protein, partial [Polaribacter sp.]|nr:T9SS type A sorting domain-containing protein [Polaribacter sp.]
NEVGRFYLHTSQNTLNSSKALLDKTAIYKINNSSLRIVGLPQEKVAVKLFNILGKQLLNTSFEGNGVNDIALPKNLNNGVYIVQLQTENGTLNKKIILDFF